MAAPVQCVSSGKLSSKFATDGVDSVLITKDEALAGTASARIRQNCSGAPRSPSATATVNFILLIFRIQNLLCRFISSCLEQCRHIVIPHVLVVRLLL